MCQYITKGKFGNSGMPKVETIKLRQLSSTGVDQLGRILLLKSIHLYNAGTKVITGGGIPICGNCAVKIEGKVSDLKDWQCDVFGFHLGATAGGFRQSQQPTSPFSYNGTA